MHAAHRRFVVKCVKRFHLFLWIISLFLSSLSLAKRTSSQSHQQVYSSLSSSIAPNHHPRNTVIQETDEAEPLESEDFLQRLMREVLGIEHASQRTRHFTPPEYMLDLYNSVAGNGGLTLTANPYHANVVRSYLDRDSSHNTKFYFNVSSNMKPKNDKLLEAEFHLYKLKPRLRSKEKAKKLSSQLLEVRVYQVMPKGKKKRKKGQQHRLLDSRRITVQSTGWEVFYVKTAVEEWIRDPQTNLGLLITVKTMEGDAVPNGVIRFAKQHHHHVNRHPLLVLFLDDGRNAKKRYYPQNNYHTYGYQNSNANHTKVDKLEEEEAGIDNLYSKQSNEDASSSTSRTQRAVGHIRKDKKQSCTRNDLYVDFEKIGWSAWIISPKGYNAYYCSGECIFPLGQNQWPTNHATVQSIVHELKLTHGVTTPCCVPNKLYSISLLYFDEHENVILKQYDDMVASSCGCH